LSRTLLLHNLDRIGEGERDQREKGKEYFLMCSTSSSQEPEPEIRAQRRGPGGPLGPLGRDQSNTHLMFSSLCVYHSCVSLHDIQMTLWNFVLSFSFYRNPENMTPQFIRSSCFHGLTSCVPNGASEGVSNQRRTLETKKFNSHESQLFHKPLLDRVVVFWPIQL
jgi:hypothetical protein